MTTWHLTLGLTGLALLGATLAPSLDALPPHAGPAPSADPPAPSGAVQVSVAADRHEVAVGRLEERFVTVTLDPVAQDVAAVDRPLDLALALDVSGSMAGDGKLDQAVRAARHVARALRPQDRLTVVTFSNAASVLAADAPGRSVLRALDGLLPGGGTNLYDGLDAAFQATQGPPDGRLRRVILLSDGQATTGRTDDASILGLAREAQAHGVSVSAVGLGLDFHEDLMAGVSDAGGGSYAFVDLRSDLTRVFASELDRSARLVARQAVLDLHLAPGVDAIELVGWEGARTADGWRVPLGDLYGGEARKVVLRVRTRAEVPGSTPLAHAALAFVDVQTERPAQAQADLAVEATASVARADASVNAPAAAQAQRAWGARLLDLASRAYARGESDEALELLDASQEAVQELEQLGYADLAAEDDAVLRAQEEVYRSVDADSFGGKEAIKRAKEASRAKAR
ncbi:MAG: VWA domain-containing protein [Alphaproteobacteria bacterium]|nr:VWA domain-containing protein [Alphaproteobacteria bacterium]